MWRAVPSGPVVALAVSFAAIGCEGSRASEDRPANAMHDASTKPASPPAPAEAGSPDSGVRMHDGSNPRDARAVDASPATVLPPGEDARPPPGEAGAAPGSDAGGCHGPGARFATGSPAHAFGPGQNNGQDKFPALVLGPPRGGGACQGSTDVVSLGNGGFVVLEFAGNAIVDGPGPDFIVFENPFEIGCDPSTLFAELGTVSVSDDGVSWTDFPCTATAPPYGACSGWHPVLANADENDIDPTDPKTAGGDPYDLADIGVTRARFVRVTDRPDLTGMAGVYDLDAVAIVNAACP